MDQVVTVEKKEKRKRKRKRSSHFDVKEEQQRRNKILIIDKLKEFNDYIRQFGNLYLNKHINTLQTLP
jgi:hypothetical protein